jgi:hypothetical protein
VDSSVARSEEENQVGLPFISASRPGKYGAGNEAEQDNEGQHRRSQRQAEVPLLLGEKRVFVDAFKYIGSLWILRLLISLKHRMRTTTLKIMV